MIDVFLYCSYNLAAAGYQLSKADYTNEKMTLINRENLNMIPGMVKTIFTHGGAKIVLGQYQSDKIYFILKGIVNENQEKNRDEQGRKVFVNIAFVGTSTDAKRMTELGQYVLGNFPEFSREICNMIIVKNDAIGYEANYSQLKEFLNRFGQGRILFMEAASGNKYLDAVKRINISSINNFAFVVLDSSWKYFFDMCGIKLNYENQKNGIAIEDFENNISRYSGLIKIAEPSPASTEHAAVSDKKPDKPVVPEPVTTVDDKPDEPAAGDMMAITNVEAGNSAALLNQSTNINIKGKNIIYILAAIGGITVLVVLFRMIRILFFKGGN